MNLLNTKRRGTLGGIRMSDDSMSAAGINRGDICHVELRNQPKDGEACAALTAYGHLVIRQYHRGPNGDIRLTAPGADTVEVFTPSAVIIFGRIARVEKGGA